MTDTLKPCPRCGGQPEVDPGLADAPYEPGFEFVGCRTVFVGATTCDQSCGSSAQGIDGWNHQPYADRLRAELEAAHAARIAAEAERDIAHDDADMWHERFQAAEAREREATAPLRERVTDSEAKLMVSNWWGRARAFLAGSPAPRDGLGSTVCSCGKLWPCGHPNCEWPLRAQEGEPHA